MQSSHICLAPNRFNKLFAAAVSNIKQSRYRDFNALACGGYSGASMAWPLLLKFAPANGIILVRKSITGYTDFLVEGITIPSRVLIVDDFTCSKTTLNRVVHGILSLNIEHEICAAYMFIDGDFVDSAVLSSVIEKQKHRVLQGFSFGTTVA